MIYTSTELFNVFMEDTRQIMVRVKINGAVFDNDNISTLNLEYGSMDGANFSLGSTFASSLKITFAELVEGLAELDEIEVEMGAVLPDETIEYVKMGTFIINEEVMMDRNNDTTSIDAMDRMVMLGETYEPTLEGDYARIIDIAVDIANQAGVVVSNDFDRLRTDSIQIPREKTLREAIGIIAQFEVGFATFNRDGELAIRRLNDPDFDISPEDYTLKGLVKNEVPFRLNGVQCQIGDSEEDALQAGASTGTQIVLNNPSMTQAHLDRIYTELSTLNYYPFSLDWYGHPALEAGDWIEIEDLQGNKFKTPNLHYTLDFNGGLKAKSQAETISSSEVVYQYKSPLQQEIQTIAARLSASGGNHVYDGLTEPENPKEGDLWFKPEGPDTLILKYTRLEDGSLDWVEKLNTGDTTKNADAIAEQLGAIEEAKQQAKLDAEKAFTDARAHADAELERINTALSVDIGGAIEAAEQAKQDAIDKANKAYEDAKAHADAEILEFNEHFDGFLAEVESEVADAQATADSAVEQIDTAVANAGFTSLDDTIQNISGIASGAQTQIDTAIQNAGFTTLSETLESTRFLGETAHADAQTAIANAQTAQSKSLEALGKADNALDGVSSLDIRVDDVEAEVALKADNTFMTEDGELITLSNAITFNAYKFRTDMQRIESKVEVLSGEVNLVILRNAFEGKRLLGGEVYPNATVTQTTNDTMAEMITVVPGEKIALSKRSITGDNFWRINLYNASGGYVTRYTIDLNQVIYTIPTGVTKMWVSYPRDSQPQIVRGEMFVPYRPNMADQMTTEEMVIFRNEYDEFADGTSRRLTAIDSSGGRLDIAEANIQTTAQGLQTAVGRMDGVETALSTLEQTASGLQSQVYNADGTSRITQLAQGIQTAVGGGRNLLSGTRDFSPNPIKFYNVSNFDIVDETALDFIGKRLTLYIQSPPSGSSLNRGIYLPKELFKADKEYIFSFYGRNWDGYAPINALASSGTITHVSSTDVGDLFKRHVFKITNNVGEIYIRPNGNGIYESTLVAHVVMPQLEYGNQVTPYSQSPKDLVSQSQITQLSGSITSSISSVDGRVTTIRQDLDSVTQTVGDNDTKLSTVEQTAEGLESAVYNEDGTSKITQLATGISSIVTNLSELDVSGRNLVVTGNEVKDYFIDSTGSLQFLVGSSTMRDYIKVTPGEVLTFTKQNKGDNYWRVAQLDGTVVYKSRLVNQSNLFQYTVPTGIGYLRVSYPTGSSPKVERGSKATPYSPAPEDVATQSQITQLADNINLRVTKDGLLSQINIEAGRTLIESNSLVLDANTIVKGDFGVSGSNVTLDANTQVQGSFTVTGGNVVLDGDTTVTGDFAVLGENIILDGDTTVLDNFTVTGGNIILDGKTTVHDDFTVTGGNVILNADTQVQGDFTVSGGNVILDGNTTVRGGFTVLGENVTLDANTTILGDFSVFGKNITLDADTTILGDFSVYGKNITLDGDTIVTGDFTVGGDIVGPGIRADNITTGELDAGQITVVNLDVSSLSGNTAEFITASFNGINSSTQIDAEGIYMSGSGLWRRTYLSATGFDLYNGSGGNNKAGAIGYFKEHYDNTATTENYFATTKDSKHYIGIGANNTHHIAFGYQSDPSINRRYAKALQIDGDTGRIRVYTSLSSKGSNYELNLAAYDDYPYGIAWERSNSGIMFASNGTKIWDESAKAWDDYDMTTRRKIGFYGDSGIQTLTTNKNMEIWTGGTTISFYTSINSQKFRISDGAIQAYTDIGMNGNNITGQSDERLKTNIRAREELIINKLKQFNFVDFDWIESGKSAFGLIAQQVQKFAPELVSMDETNMLTLNNTLLNMYTTKSVVEINQKVDDLSESTDDKIHKLQQELSKANRRIEELEGAI